MVHDTQRTGQGERRTSTHYIRCSAYYLVALEVRRCAAGCGYAGGAVPWVVLLLSCRSVRAHIIRFWCHNSRGVYVSFIARKYYIRTCVIISHTTLNILKIFEGESDFRVKDHLNILIIVSHFCCENIFDIKLSILRTCGKI